MVEMLVREFRFWRREGGERKSSNFSGTRFLNLSSEPRKSVTRIFW